MSAGEHPKEETSVSVRLPESLAAELRTLARRDCNGVSATIRRLLTRAIAHEHAVTGGSRG